MNVVAGKRAMTRTEIVFAAGKIRIGHVNSVRCDSATKQRSRFPTGVLRGNLCGPGTYQTAPKHGNQKQQSSVWLRHRQP